MDPAYDDRVQQFRRVQKFFERFRNPDGSLQGGFAEYDAPQAFRDRLRIDLRAFIERKLAAKKTDSPAGRIKAPPPYGAIAKALSAERVVPIISAGSSRCGRRADAPWTPCSAQFLPSGAELPRFLADETAFPAEEERERLAEVASYYEAFQTRATLRERLRQVLGPETLAGAAVPSLYDFLVKVPKPLVIVTTNYNTQIERAFQNAGKPYELVVYLADRKVLANAVLWWPHGAAAPETPAANAPSIDLETTTVIFKMHGSILPETDEWDSFVITEADCVEFISRIRSKSAIPALFATHCRDRSLLFLGYNLRGLNFRTVLQSLNRFFAKRVADYDQEEIPSWAVDEDFSELEIKFWQKRGVCPHETRIDEFIERLRERMPK